VPADEGRALGDADKCTALRYIDHSLTQGRLRTDLRFKQRQVIIADDAQLSVFHPNLKLRLRLQQKPFDIESNRCGAVQNRCPAFTSALATISMLRF
jgi:hypothetical protein